MQMRGCRNQNIWGDNKAAGATSCLLPPSHCQARGRASPGGSHSSPGPPSAGSTAHEPLIDAPTQEHPKGLGLSPPTPASPCSQDRIPQHTVLMPDGLGKPSLGLYGLFPPPLSSCVITRPHQGGPWHCSCPFISTHPGGCTAEVGCSPAAATCRMQGCSRDRIGAYWAWTHTIQGIEPPKMTQGDTTGPTPARSWLPTAPPAPLRHLASTKAPLLQRSRMGRTRREVRPSPLPSPKILAQPGSPEGQTQGWGSSPDPPQG